MPLRSLNHFVALLGLLLGAFASVASVASAATVDSPGQAPSVAPALVPDTPATQGASTEAGTVSANETTPAGSPVAAGQHLLEATRRSARSTAEWLARGVDSWFGSVPFDEGGGNVSDGRLSLGFFKRQDQSTDVGLRFNAHYRLPNLEQRAYLFIGRDVRRDVVRDTPDTLVQQQRLLTDQRAEHSFLAGIGLSVFDTIDFRIGLGGGARPYAQARYEKSWTPAPNHLFDFRETVFWTNDDRFGSTTALSYEYAVSPTLALRWLNAVTITQESRNFEYSNSLGTYHALGGQRLLSFEAVFNGTDTRRTGGGLSDLGLLAKWEQPIYETWAFIELVGGHYWPRPDALSPRSRAWAAGATLKLRF